MGCILATHYRCSTVMKLFEVVAGCCTYCDMTSLKQLVCLGLKPGQQAPRASVSQIDLRQRFLCCTCLC